MASLKIVENGDVRFFKIDKQIITIGRLPGCDILLAEPKASKQHCQILRHGNSFTLRDLGSKNGTWIGSHRTDECDLKEGMTFRIGQALITATLDVPQELKLDLTPVPAPKSPKRDEGALDKLVIEATGRHSHVSDKPMLDPEDWIKLDHRRKMIQIGVASLVLVGILGFIVYLRHASLLEATVDQRIQAENTKKNAERDEKVFAEIEPVIKDYLDKNQFVEAQKTLDAGRARGLAEDHFIVLRQSIETKAMERCREVCQEGQKALKDGNLQKARDVYESARIPAGFGGSCTEQELLNQAIISAERVSVDERNKQARLKQEREHEGLFAKGAKRLTEIQELYDNRDYPAALELWLDSRSLTFKERSEFDEWRDKLQKKIKGGVIIEAEPKTASILIKGHKPAKSGEIIWGLPMTAVDIEIRAEGFMSAHQTVAPGFPEPHRIDAIPLIRSAPPAVWAAYSLQGRPALELARRYYEITSAEEPWLPVIRKICNATAQTAGNLSKKSRPDWKREIDRFLTTIGKSPADALLFLSETTATDDPEFMSKASEDCVAGIGKCLDAIGRSCPDCLGDREVMCKACGGKKKHMALGPCPDCKGMGTKICPACNGTAKKNCSRCGGAGHLLVDNPPIKGRPSTSHTETCLTCNGSGKQPCHKCNAGRLECLGCRGTKTKMTMRPCSECSANGVLPCKTCNATGERAGVNIQRRLEIEKALQELSEPTLSNNISKSDQQKTAVESSKK